MKTYSPQSKALATDVVLTDAVQRAVDLLAPTHHLRRHCDHVTPNPCHCRDYRARAVNAAEFVLRTAGMAVERLGGAR